MQSLPNTLKTIGFYTMGCRLNIFESDGLSSKFQKLGLSTIPIGNRPDIIVINTCTVTNKADSKNRNVIRHLVKTYPSSQIWVTGCYAETDKNVIENIPGITGVVSNSQKSKLPEIILEKNNIQFQSKPNSVDPFSYSDVLPVEHTRAYLKIQDGCNRICSYCKIPQARGKGVSRNFLDVLDQVKFLQDNGIGEIILTGVNIGWYKSNQKKSFSSLLKSILDILDYSRLRISSIEPSDVNLELAELLSHPRFCKFLHVPLQSGSKEILKKMKRSYTPETYRKRLEIVKRFHPNLFLGTDVITGFPDETENDFMDTIKIIEELGICKIHAFPFSVRKGTLAENYIDNIKKSAKKARIQILNNLSNSAYYNYGFRFKDKILECILEGDGFCTSDNFLRILPTNLSQFHNLKSGQFLNIRITGFNHISRGHFIGEIVTSV